MSVRAQPFEIAIPDGELRDLARRLRRTRWAHDFDNQDWRYGVTGEYLHALAEYWLDEFDWRAREAEMNALPQFKVEIDGVPIHFMYVRGRGARVLPLMLTHGWPWTFWDFAKVIGPLSDPASHGLDDAIAFDLVVPSLPGHGFSSPLTKPLDDGDIADLWTKLMTEVLGYDRFGSHGGDRGALVTANLAHAHAEQLIGAHQSLPVLPGLDYHTITAEDYGPDEQGWYKSWQSRFHTTVAHVAIHRDDPQTLAWALNDSPIGLAAWIVERRHDWSQWSDSFEEVFTKDDVLITTSVYWHTGTSHTMARLYAETRRAPWEPRHDREPRFPAPMGFAIFPGELVLAPRKVMERNCNLVRWTVMPRGGHFGAHEQPDLLVEDLRQFFAALPD
jgi:pimeloyl-ACP methyl ester carboxylesterase